MDCGLLFLGMNWIKHFRAQYAGHYIQGVLLAAPFYHAINNSLWPLWDRSHHQPAHRAASMRISPLCFRRLWVLIRWPSSFLDCHRELSYFLSKSQYEIQRHHGHDRESEYHHGCPTQNIDSWYMMPFGIYPSCIEHRIRLYSAYSRSLLHLLVVQNDWR